MVVSGFLNPRCVSLDLAKQLVGCYRPSCFYFCKKKVRTKKFLNKLICPRKQFSGQFHFHVGKEKVEFVSVLDCRETFRWRTSRDEERKKTDCQLCY